MQPRQCSIVQRHLLLVQMINFDIIVIFHLDCRLIFIHSELLIFVQFLSHAADALCDYTGPRLRLFIFVAFLNDVLAT